LRPRGLVIAIDGPSGAGKSTAGRAVAVRLGYTFIDTGAMYRALALKALRTGVSLDSAEALAELAGQTRIGLADGGRTILLDGEDVSGSIRTREVSLAASKLSAHAPVRHDLVARQRKMGKEGGVVLDGRDIGTQVFPDAELKLYVDADPRIRAERRQRELAAAGKPAELSVIEAEIRARDHNDQTRASSPLVRAEDAVLVDTTHLTPDQVVDRILEGVRSRLLTSGSG
jgi:cytidylate kinase